MLFKSRTSHAYLFGNRATDFIADLHPLAERVVDESIKVLGPLGNGRRGASWCGCRERAGGRLVGGGQRLLEGGYVSGGKLNG